MIVAIATFDTRVSPRFDCAQSFRVVRLEEGRVAEDREISSGDWAPHQRVGKLAELGAQVVICGAIDRWSAESLQAEGVKVYGWITGEAEDALNCFVRGELVPEAIMAPGGRCCGRWRFRGGRAAPAVEPADPAAAWTGDGQGPLAPPRGSGRGGGGRGGGGRGRGAGRGNWP